MKYSMNALSLSQWNESSVYEWYLFLYGLVIERGLGLKGKRASFIALTSFSSSLLMGSLILLYGFI
jgi:hypothetical protein